MIDLARMLGISRLTAALHANPDRCVLVGAYALGKAQRVIRELRDMGHDDPIYIHGAMQRLCDLYVEQGVDLGDLRAATGVAKAELMGRIVMAPPSALNDRWSRRRSEGPRVGTECVSTFKSRWAP